LLLADDAVEKELSSTLAAQPLPNGAVGVLRSLGALRAKD
jgi:hypothetical protein